MSLRVGSAALYISPVAPVARVRVRTADEAAPARDDSLPVGSEGTSRWSDDLRRQRSEALSELQGVTPSATNLVRKLDRQQLAAMVYDRDGRFAVEQRSSALAQMQANDREFLERARDLASASGDDRVFYRAVIELEDAKSAVERAMPEGETGPDVSALRRDIAARTTELAGAPASLSLHYPNGLAPPARAAVASAVSPGAARVAQVYRDDTLF
jgi:hypothetical protein